MIILVVFQLCSCMRVKLLGQQCSAWVLEMIQSVIELWWTSYLFIQVVLWWSACHCRTTGVSRGHIGQEGCLSETCHYVTVMQICSLVKLIFCCIDVENMLCEETGKRE